MASLWTSLVVSFAVLSGPIPSSSRAKIAIDRVKPKLESQLEARSLKWGSPLFIRIFKETSELEVWLQSGTSYSHFKTYPICFFSGKLGPKLQQGDGQSPEGFYFVTPERMNPSSTFHLAFNLGYPNRYERELGRTGDFLMVHGDCVSIGCYAMTNPLIEEIYALASAALRNGQAFFRVHSFPFRMTRERMAKTVGSQWHEFWKNLQEGYNAFEKTKIPPNVRTSDKRYVFENTK